MRILLINKFHYLKGGSETYYFSLNKLLTAHGHEVAVFSMEDERNIPSEYSDYFVKNIDYNKGTTLLNKIKLAAKFIYSFEAASKLEKLITDFKPDIAHLHIFQHQLSPSILWTLKKNKIPIVYTAHDFKMVCPNYRMLAKGRICEACNGGRYLNCLKKRCIKGSLFNSLLNVKEAYVHKIIKSYDLIDRIITPSNFYREKFIEFGVNSERVVFVPNFLFEADYTPHYDFKDYFIYLGRLSEEKGVDTLLRAMKSVQGKLIIAGTGPSAENLKEWAENEGLTNKVEFAGYKTGDELKSIINEAMFIVVPSKWYENAPYSILEAMASGKAVIGANIGGIPEMIKDEETGLIFRTEDHEDLAQKINQLLLKPETAADYGRNARAAVEKLYGSEEHYLKILKIYEELIDRRQNGN
ncbi:MAG: glycosyltransferase family 4 protein [Clostridiaceae bacterium]